MTDRSKKVSIAILLIALIIIIAPYGKAEDELEPQKPDELIEETQAKELVPLMLTGQIVDGGFLVPMRQLFELLGAEVEWDGQAQRVIGVKGETAISLTIDSPVALIDNREVPLATPATLINDSTFVPARIVGETLGAVVEWNEDLPAAVISTEEYKIFVRQSYPEPILGQGEIVAQPEDILVLVNKQHWLPADYVPTDLVMPDIPFSFAEDRPSKQMRAEAAQALEELFALAKEHNYHLVGVSGYRSYRDQDIIFTRNARQKGEEIANLSSARPGQSEHQTGLAMDVSSLKVNYRLDQAFGKTPEGEWLVQNAPDFGFIIRYPQGKTHITGYIYEPWHLRYVGVEAAREIASKNITLEEYVYAGEFKEKVHNNYGIEL